MNRVYVDKLLADARASEIELWTERIVNRTFNFHRLIVFRIVLHGRLAMLEKTDVHQRANGNSC